MIFPLRKHIIPFIKFIDYFPIRDYMKLNIYEGNIILAISWDINLQTPSDWWVGTCFNCPFSWECHHPNWRTHIFQRGRLNQQPAIDIGFSNSIFNHNVQWFSMIFQHHSLMNSIFKHHWNIRCSWIFMDFHGFSPLPWSEKPGHVVFFFGTLNGARFPRNANARPWASLFADVPCIRSWRTCP